MRQPPDISDSLIQAILRDAYGVVIEELSFLPLGADVGSAAYRAEGKDGSAYFVKLRRGSVAATIQIEDWLAHAGMQAVIAPIRTRSGAPSARFAGFSAVLYPFVQARSGWDVELTPEQWSELGSALAYLHDAAPPADLSNALLRETWSSEFRQQVRAFLARAQESPADPCARELATLLTKRRETIESILARAERGAELLARKPSAMRLSHGDIHAGNVLVDMRGQVNIVDWDTLGLAPRERDLMFIGAGVGGMWSRREEAEWFYRGYGETVIDPVALTYYRFEHIVRDIAEICAAVFDGSESEEDRATMLVQFADQFRPGNVVEQAMRGEPGRFK